jgi:hypothetical protein
MAKSPTQLSNEGRMRRLSIHQGLYVRSYEVECGAHGCTNAATVHGAAEARRKGWHRDRGYGWICPTCATKGTPDAR